MSVNNCESGVTKYAQEAKMSKLGSTLVKTSVMNAKKCEILELKNILRMFCGSDYVLLLFFVLICILRSEPLVAQNEMQFGGYANSTLVVNPGAAGKTGSYEAGAAYRKQWAGFEGSPSTTILSVDGEVKFLNNFHGVGASVFRDNVGPFTTTNINADYSYHIELGSGMLGLGLRLGAMNVAFKASGLSPSVNGGEDDYHQSSDEALDGNDGSATAFDVGMGGFFQSDRSFVSLSLLHLDAPTAELKGGAKIKAKPLLTFGAGRRFGQSNGFEPRIFMKTDFGSMQLEVSGSTSFGKLVTLGMGYRLQDAIFFLLGVKLSNGLYVGYEYDVCTSVLRRYNNGSHEIVASYQFSIDVEKRTKRYKSVRIL